MLKASSYKTGLDDVRKEINILKKLNHPNIIKLHEILEDEKCDNLFLSEFFLYFLSFYHFFIFQQFSNMQKKEK